jgi:asparagine synthase (glutamine-hydrolysing)
MCGFAAAVFVNCEVDERALLRASGSIEHRGPDDHGYLARGAFAMAFRRLAILDLSSTGHQPMVSGDRRLAVVFNGEIYNYVELRAELADLGHRFVSSGDTEVLLAAYAEWGTDCLAKLRGMFAFCMHDAEADTFFVARDRFGIKPLYIARVKAGVAFASEMKALRASGLWSGTHSESRFASILSYGRTDAIPEDDGTVLEGVRQVPPACAMIVSRDGQVKTWRYWDATLFERDASPQSSAAFLAAFDDSVRLHLRSDVPVGVMLSGGMDSTALACSMKVLSTKQSLRDIELHAFSYQSPDFDEAEQIHDTLALTGAVPHVLHDGNATDIWNDLARTVWHHDEPVHSPTVLVSYKLYELAARTGIRVVLNGQGADETLGGYAFFFEHMLFSKLLSLSFADFRREMNAALPLLGQSNRQLIGRLASLGRSHFLKSSARYRTIWTQRRLSESLQGSFLAADFAELAEPSPRVRSGEEYSDAIIRSITEAPLPQYLRVEDRNSMAHSIESRVPFLDHLLVEFALRSPVNALTSDGWNKRILRESLKGRIPESVRTRRTKLGFPTAARNWFAGPLADPLREILASGPAQRSGWFNIPALKMALESHVRQRQDHTKALFNFSQVNAWLTLNENGWKKP